MVVTNFPTGGGKISSLLTPNLLMGTKDFSKPWDLGGWTVAEEKYLGFTVITKSTKYADASQATVNIKTRERYTFSFLAKGTGRLEIVSSLVEESYAQVLKPSIGSFELTEEWKQCVYMFEVTRDCTLPIRFEISTDDITAYACAPKLERGENPNPIWTPAPDDVILTKQDLRAVLDEYLDKKVK